MTREIRLTSEQIVESSWIASRPILVDSGACVCFVGSVRGTEHGAPILGILYEAYDAMAQHQFHKILDQIESRWPIQSIRLVHRIGRVCAGQPSIVVEVTSTHRAEAFEACQFLIEEMKQRVPIWKQPLL